MSTFDGASYTSQVSRLRRLAHAMLVQYDLDVARTKIINHGENATFEVRAVPRWAPAQGPRRYVLRITRPRHHDRVALTSELAWIQALADDANIFAPPPVPSAAGDLVVEAAHPGVPEPRYGVLFGWLKGAIRQDHPGPASMRQLGALAATMHRQASSWTPPPGFKRPRWDVAGLAGDDGVFGSPFAVPGIDAEQRLVLEDARALLVEEMGERMQEAENVGMIHADLFLTNVIFRAGEAQPIDFDDCGFGHWLYDIAVTFRHLRHHPERYARLHAAFQEGYRGERAHASWTRDELEPFHMARAFMELAWQGSRADHPEVREETPRCVDHTVRVALDYLTR